MGSNGGPNELDGAVFLNLTAGNVTGSQMMYVTPPVTCLILSQRACRELLPAHPNFLAKATETGQTQRTTMDSKGRGRWEKRVHPHH